MPNKIKNKLNPLFLSKLENLYGPKSNNSIKHATPGTGISNTYLQKKDKNINHSKPNIIIKKPNFSEEIQKELPVINNKKTILPQLPTNISYLSAELVKTILIHYNYQTKLFLDCYSTNIKKKKRKKRKKSNKFLFCLLSGFGVCTSGFFIYKKIIKN